MSTDQPGPSLSDDEAALMTYAMALAEAVDAAVGEWIRWSIADRAPNVATTPEADRAVAEGTAEISAEIRLLLAQDIADQTEGPLQVLRRGVRFATAVLADASVPAQVRDDFAVRAFPDDVYDLSPASFGSVHPSLHEPGLIWGAAKAHVHLRRRRDSET